jgi:hypothetical protein
MSTSVLSRSRVRRTTTKGILSCALAATTLMAAPAIAGATDITVNDDAAGPGPAGANCAAPDFATIPAAISAAAASGDRLLVCAGTYVQNQVLISKSIDLIGAGPGQSIIDGGNATGLPSAGLIRTNDSTNGDVLVHGFTVQNPGQVGVSPTANRIAIIPKGDDLGATQEFSDLEVVGLGVGGRDYGVDLDNPDPDVILRDSTITGTDFNAVLIERADGAVTVRDNTIAGDGTGSPVFAMNHTNDPTTNPLRILDNDVETGGAAGIVVQSSFQDLGTPGAFNAVDVKGNEIHATNSIGIAITNPTAGNGALGEIANVNIDDNAVDGTATATGVRIQGRVDNVGIRGNTLAGLGTGVLVNPASAGHAPTRVSAAYNRIAGNAIAGLTSNVTAPIKAEHNWWGCNAGPGQSGCDIVNGTGTVDFDPWLVLGLTASPSAIQTGGETSRLTADLLTDSEGDPVAGDFPAGTPVTFATTLGSVTSPVDTGRGTATSTLSSGAEAGTADVTASLDGETVSRQVTITEPAPAAPETTIDAGPANSSSTQDTTPTFAFSSDDPNATFQCRYDGAVFAACSGPGATHTPAGGLSEGIHTFEVRAVDAASHPDPTPAARTFLVDVLDPRDNPGKFTLGRTVANKKKGTARVTANVPAAGTVSLTGKKVKTQTRQATAAGTIDLKVKPTAKTRAKLKKRGKAKVKVTVTYTAADGSQTSEDKTIALKRRVKG